MGLIVVNYRATFGPRARSEGAGRAFRTTDLMRYSLHSEECMVDVTYLLCTIYFELMDLGVYRDAILPSRLPPQAA